ncbi:VanZ family protein [Streptomyces sp. CA-111067]|uniref:VanZ family protein n=1 Tax=Streptomyces sp. CA-111067 TaxID=3240046 RepID=UPI003D971A6E
MLSTALQGQSWPLLVTVVVALLVACAIFSVVRRNGRRPFEYSCLSALVVVELSVTLVMSNGGYESHNCVVNHDFAEPFRTSQGWLNVLLFLPIGLAGALATRALLPAVVGSAALSLITEFSQALVPGVGRNCDSSDFTANVVGALLGALTAFAYMNALGAKVPLDRYWRPTVYSGVSAGVIAAIIGAVGITFIPMDGTGLQFASRHEVQAAQQEMRRSFGDRYSVSKVQYQPPVGGEGGAGNLLMVLDDGKGSAQLSWPKTRVLTVSFENSSKVTDESFPIPGTRGNPTTAADALAIATTYAQQYHPDSIRSARSSVAPVGKEAELGWMVSWRRIGGNGVVMPMQLDVEINRAGRISQMVTADIADPGSLPPIRISRSSAVQRAKASVAALLSSAQDLTVSHVELKAVQRENQWRCEYLVSYSGPDGKPIMAMSYVDATTGAARSE